MVKKNDPKSSAGKHPVEGKECNILKLKKFGLLKGEKKKKSMYLGVMKKEKANPGHKES